MVAVYINDMLARDKDFRCKFDEIPPLNRFIHSEIGFPK